LFTSRDTTWSFTKLKKRINTLCLVSPQISLKIVGTEGTEAITHIAMSNDGRYVSVCERNVPGEKGLVTIYETISRTRKQRLPDGLDQGNKYKSQEFVCSAFSVTSSIRKEEIIVTLTGAPDWQILVWEWEKCQLLSICSVGIPA
jgi:hypothetical protein